ncbi:Cytochrome P450 domain containing protein [Aphelenchoides besseyi]|nr:Cytochrome P450 domain containing protein [Aphelenchoides besseyi]KAI6211017.1 Cytochrome P450 domain containing protein [Aphelenchoides besseyi]
MGKNLMQTKIHQQIEELISDCLEEQNQKGVVDLPANIERCVGSVICRMLFGHSFQKDDFERYRKQMHELAKNFFTPTMMVISYVDFAHRLPYFKTYYEKLVKTCEEFRRYFDSELREHERKLETGEVDEKSADDFVYVYMNEMRKNQPESYFHEKMLRALVLDLFITGQETTSATLVFLIIYVLNHPHVQVEIHRELDEKIGSDRLVETADRNELVYLNAVINETQRLHNLLPFNLLHKNNKPVVVNGFQIPKGTAIAPQISCVLSDPKIFPEPEKFKPERFVDSEGKLKKFDELIPFSVGKRECIGRSLATMELLLITANLFNRFRLAPSDPKHPPTMEKIVEFGARYHPFSVQMYPRF